MEKSLKIIKYLILGGIFLAPFIVLIVTSSPFFSFYCRQEFFLPHFNGNNFLPLADSGYFQQKLSASPAQKELDFNCRCFFYFNSYPLHDFQRQPIPQFLVKL